MKPKLSFAIFTLVLTATGSRAVALTPDEAQSLPTAELAKLVLGELGETIVTVERPTWPKCSWTCSPRVGTSPPLNSGIRFLQAPGARTPGQGKWSGLCTRRVFNVHFSTDGKAATLVSSDRYLVPDHLRERTDQLGSDVTEYYRLANRECEAKWTDQYGFLADNLISAEQAALAATVFAQLAPQADTLGIKVECSQIEPTFCEDKNRNQKIAEAIAPSRFSRVEQVSCSGEREPVLNISVHSCYSIHLNEPIDRRSVFPEWAFMEITQLDYGLRIDRIEYNRAIAVVYD